MQKKSLSLFVVCSFLAACGGGGGGDSAQSPTQEVSPPSTGPDNLVTAGTDAGQTDGGAPSSSVEAPTSDSGSTSVPTDQATTTDGGTTTSDGGTTAQVEPPIVVTPPPPPVPIAFFALDTSSSNVSAGSGLIEEANDRITLAGFSGTISNDGSMVTLDNGGQISLLPSDTMHVGLFQLEPSMGDPSFGVYGRPTNFSTFSPGAAAEYTGTRTAIVQIIDGTNIYDLTGDVSIDVNFEDGLVDIALTNLDGQRTDGLSAPVNIMDVAQLGVTGGQLSNGTFSAGSANFASTQISNVLSGQEEVSSRGGLFGDAGEEVGGVFVIDDSAASGRLLIRGQYVGN